MHLRLDWALVKMVFGRSSNNSGDWAELQRRLGEAAMAIGQSRNGNWQSENLRSKKRLSAGNNGDWRGDTILRFRHTFSCLGIRWKNTQCFSISLFQLEWKFIRL